MAGKFNVSVDLKDLKEAKKTFDAMGKLPQRIVSASAAKAATAVKKAVKNSEKAPKDSGLLRRAIIRTPEKSRRKGKKVYDIRFDPTWNDEFQVKKRPIKNPGEFGGKSDHAYYPASMEYGFLTRSKGGGISYYPGHYFMRDEGEAMRGESNEIMARTLNEKLEKEWTKRHGT